jgi:hypothetical protein
VAGRCVGLLACWCSSSPTLSLARSVGRLRESVLFTALRAERACAADRPRRGNRWYVWARCRGTGRVPDLDLCVALCVRPNACGRERVTRCGWSSRWCSCCLAYQVAQYILILTVPSPGGPKPCAQESPASNHCAPNRAFHKPLPLRTQHSALSKSPGSYPACWSSCSSPLTRSSSRARWRSPTSAGSRSATACKAACGARRGRA